MKLTKLGIFYIALAIFFMFFTVRVFEAAFPVMPQTLDFIPMSKLSVDALFYLLMFNFCMIFICCWGFVEYGITQTKEYLIKFYGDNHRIDITDPLVIDKLINTKDGLVCMQRELLEESRTLQTSPLNNERINKQIANRDQYLKVNQYLNEVEETIKALIRLKELNQVNLPCYERPMK